MGEHREIRLPDIGDFEDVDVAEILVAAGATVAAETSLIVLESDKATMEIPSPWEGVVVEMKVAVGDKVSQGALIALIEVEEASAAQDIQPDDTTPAATRYDTAFRRVFGRIDAARRHGAAAVLGQWSTQCGHGSIPGFLVGRPQ